MELIVKNGKTFWTLVTETVSINSYFKWEQAFRTFSDIYMRHQPSKSTELIQYNHVIHSIFLTYVWDNIYPYDKEFRIHLSKHPECNWGVILQQAWSMKLRDRLSGGGNEFRTSQSPASSHHNNFSTPGQKGKIG